MSIDEHIPPERYRELWAEAERQCLHGADGRLIYPAHDADGRDLTYMFNSLVLKEAIAIAERRIAALPNV